MDETKLMDLPANATNQPVSGQAGEKPKAKAKAQPKALKQRVDLESDRTVLPLEVLPSKLLFEDEAGNQYYLDETGRGAYLLRLWKRAIPK